MSQGRFSFFALTIAVSLCAGSAGSNQAHARVLSLMPTQTAVGLDGVGYLHSSSQAPEGFQNTFSPQLIGKLNVAYEGTLLQAGAQINAMVLFNRMERGSSRATPYFEMPELYLGVSPKLSPVQLVFGRKLEAWSQLDEQWGLGLWQPRYRWDYLHPEIVGLTGAFLVIEQPWWRLTGWVSPIFVPERGVPISAEGGAFASDSRWFVPPPQAVRLFDEPTPVRYTLNVPATRELIANPGGSLRARFGAAQGPWGALGYAHKPINQLFLANTGVLQLAPTSDAIYGDADIYARVLYHQLMTAEAGYRAEPVSAWISVLKEKPLRDQTASDWTTQEAEPATLVSSNVDFRVAGSSERPTRVDLSYLRLWGGNAGDQGQDAPGDGTTRFEARYPFQSALAVGLRSDAITRVSASARVLYDFSHDGAVWSTEIRYRPHGNWELGVGADLLTSSQPAEQVDEADLIGRYRANDRVHAGVTYVF